MRVAWHLVALVSSSFHPHSSSSLPLASADPRVIGQLLLQPLIFVPLTGDKEPSPTISTVVQSLHRHVPSPGSPLVLEILHTTSISLILILHRIQVMCRTGLRPPDAVAVHHIVTAFHLVRVFCFGDVISANQAGFLGLLH